MTKFQNGRLDVGWGWGRLNSLSRDFKEEIWKWLELEFRAKENFFIEKKRRKNFERNFFFEV